MKLTHTSRLLAAIVAIFSMLYMQLAVASYVCPGMAAGSQSEVAVSTAMADEMPNCDSMDTEQTTLCHVIAHGEPAKQSLEKPPASIVPPFVPVELGLNLAMFVVTVLPDLPAYPPIALTRTSSPPIAIRNCCFRI